MYFITSFLRSVYFGASTNAKHEYKSTHNGAAANTLFQAINTLAATSIERAIEDISKNKYDMIAVGRALLSDPEWVLKMKEGRLNDVIPYTKEALLNLY